MRGGEKIRITVGNNIGLRNVEPVSYTHLDVYKRQVTHAPWVYTGRVQSSRKTEGPNNK